MPIAVYEITAAHVQDGIGARFEFPADAVTRALAGYAGWQDWFRSRVNTGGEAIDLDAAPRETLGFFPTDVLFALVLGGNGTVHCPACRQTGPAARIRMEKWAMGGGGGGAWGRLLACECGQVLLRTVEQVVP